MKYHNVSSKAYFAMFIVAAPVYFLFSSLNQDVRGFISALTICGFGSLISILRDISKKPRFWLISSFIVIVHVVIIILIPWGNRVYFGILATPIVVADMYASARLIVSFTGSDAA